MSDEMRNGLIERFETSRAELKAAIEGLTTAQMVERSIDGWSLKDHLLHLANWDDVRASEVERISAGFDSACRMSHQQDADFDAMSYDLRKDLSLEQAMWELEHSRARLLTAIRQATDRGLDPSLYGEAGLVNGHESEHAGWIQAWRQRLGI
jgi:hypothetical protein